MGGQLGEGLIRGGLVDMGRVREGEPRVQKSNRLQMRKNEKHEFEMVKIETN